jgi:hypothetical protein
MFVLGTIACFLGTSYMVYLVFLFLKKRAFVFANKWADSNYFKILELTLCRFHRGPFFPLPLGGSVDIVVRAIIITKSDDVKGCWLRFPDVLTCPTLVKVRWDDEFSTEAKKVEKPRDIDDCEAEGGHS